jgi:hypothetical protein
MPDKEIVVTSPPAVLVVFGASGAGKTTLVRGIAAQGLDGVGCYYFDSMGIPSVEEMVARFGDGAAFQAWGLDQWLRRIVRNEDRVRLAILDAQVRPSAVRAAFAAHSIAVGRMVLVDCAAEERSARLRGARGQPELATAEMDGWAAYLRGQADALEVPVIDTTGQTPDAALPSLRSQVLALLNTLTIDAASARWTRW